MAELTGAPLRQAHKTSETDHSDKPLPGAIAYLLLARMWSRAAWQYRVSLLLTGTTQALATSLDLAALLVIYGQVQTLYSRGHEMASHGVT